METLRSLVRPFFGAIWAIASGTFGWQPAVASLVSLLLSWAIFASLNPASSAVASVLAVAVLLFISATIAFWSGLIANGSAYERPGKGTSWQSIWLTSVVVALVWGTLSAALGLGVVDFFVDIDIRVWLTALVNALVTGTIVASAMISALKSLAQK
jgi:hypothetical protein